MAVAPIMGTQILPIQQSVPVNANTTVARGLRLTFDSTGTAFLAGATIRGEYVSLVTSGSAGGVHLAAPLQAPGSVPMSVAAATVAVGDGAYSAAAGQVTNVSTNAVLIGKFKQAGVANGLAIVQLENPL